MYSSARWQVACKHLASSFSQEIKYKGVSKESFLQVQWLYHSWGRGGQRELRRCLGNGSLLSFLLVRFWGVACFVLT